MEHMVSDVNVLVNVREVDHNMVIHGAMWSFAMQPDCIGNMQIVV